MTTLQALAFDLSKCGLANTPRQRRGRLPSTALCDKATTRVNNFTIARRGLAHDTVHKQIHKRPVVPLERANVKSSLRIEYEQLVHEPDDCTGNAIAKLNDCVHETNTLTGEAQQAMVFRIIQHGRKFRTRQPVQGVVRAHDKYSG